MGFFDFLFGGKKGPSALLRNFAELLPAARMMASEQLLGQVAQQLGLQGAQIKQIPEDYAVSLRGEVDGIKYRIKIDVGGSPDIELKYPGHDLEYIDIEHDPEVTGGPGDEEDAFEQSEERHFLAKGVYIEGSSSKKELAHFRALPEALQQKVIAAILNCRIRYFRSRREEHDTDLYQEVGDREDPVAWLVEALGISLEIARHRIANEEPKATKGGKDAKPGGRKGPLRGYTDLDEDERWKAVESYAATLDLVKSGRAQVVPRKNDEEIDVRFTEQGVPMRFVFDVSFDDFEIHALAEGVGGRFHLICDDDVALENEAPAEDAWSSTGERRIFLANHVFVSGSDADVRAEVATLRALPAETLAALLGALTDRKIEAAVLDDGSLHTVICDLEVADEGAVAHALGVAGLFARVVTSLPRGGASPAITGRAQRCSYCHAYWFVGPGSERCANCGAPS